MPAPLTATTPNDTDVVVVRSFDAPRDLVWRAHTDPTLVKKWLLGPPGWTMPICEIDLRVGGRYRYGWAHPTQGAFEMTGAFNEILSLFFFVVVAFLALTVAGLFVLRRRSAGGAPLAPVARAPAVG